MDTMYFEPMNTEDDEVTIEIADDLQMPQFSLFKRLLIDCSMNYTTGRLVNIVFLR